MIVCILIVTGFVIGIAHHAFSSQVRNNVQGTAIGTLALEIGRSAIQEAYWSLETRLDDPDHNPPVTGAFRSDTGPGSVAPMAIEIPDVRRSWPRILS